MRVLSLVSLAFALGAAGAPATTAQPAAPKPCSGPEHRQFDFWIGDWEVETPDGKPAGTNRIERILDGCVLQESWTGARGMRGMSFNMYSAADKRWHQSWVDTGGNLLSLAGGLEDGRMILAGDTPQADGRVVANRITWQKLDDGRVRQHWETSADSGRTWQDAFVGLYRRKPQPGGSR
jgi:hypothetical protein